MFTPLALARDSASRTVIAIWIYQDASMAVVHLDFQYKERYILWDAPDAHHVERRPIWADGTIPRDEPTTDDDEPRVKVMVPLSPADPFLFTQNILRDLWEGAMERGTTPRGPPRFTGPSLSGSTSSRSSRRAIVGHRRTGAGRPFGRYCKACRRESRSIFTPSALAREAASRTVIAIWIYQDASMAVVHLDFQYKERCILWHAPDAQQFNFDYLEELRHRLSTLSLEVPDQLDRILSEK